MEYCSYWEYSRHLRTTVGYDHDALGRRTKLTYPDNSYITYEYDAMDRLTDIKDDSTPAAVTLVHYNYDELSRRDSAQFDYNGDRILDAQTVYDYEDKTTGDDLGTRLENVINYATNGTTEVSKFEYAYDNVGNRETMTVDGTANNHIYGYDNIYQLLNVIFKNWCKKNWRCPECYVALFFGDTI